MAKRLHLCAQMSKRERVLAEFLALMLPAQALISHENTLGGAASGWAHVSMAVLIFHVNMLFVSSNKKFLHPSFHQSYTTTFQGKYQYSFLLHRSVH